MEKFYWKRSNGELIDVDEMNEYHLRNALKQLLREKQHNTPTNNDIPSKYDVSDKDLLSVLKS